MTTDLEADLRREFDAATPPSGMTFHPESVLRQGNRTLRRHRIIAAGSAAVAVALVATGAGLLTRPNDTAAPLPASHKATTGIVQAHVGFASGTALVELNRDVSVQPNVKYSYVTLDGVPHEVGTSSTGKPGQKPDATWRSAMVDGHPVTIGLVPSPARNVTVTFADGTNHGIAFDELKGTGSTMFTVDYTPVKGEKQATRPAEIASIRWSAPNGIVDGIEGDHRITGRELFLSKTLSVELVLQPVDGGNTAVFGNTYVHFNGDATGAALTRATADPAGAAVVTGREAIPHTDAKGVVFVNDGAPIAAGILPPGASNIGVILTAGEALNPVVVLVRLPDGRVTFAVKAESAHPSVPSKDSIKAVTWTNADGTRGHKDVPQKQS